MIRAPRREARAPARSAAALGYRFPAEWEPHEATWLAWPHHRPDWPGKADAIPWVFAELTRALVVGERVRIIVPTAAVQAQAKRVLERAGVDLGQVDFVRHLTDRSWTRDYLPQFVVRRGARGRLGAVKWRFNGWARYPNHRRDEAAGVTVAQRYADCWWQPTTTFRGRPRPVVLEGGGIDVDGQGTLLASDDWLLSGARARNRMIDRSATERVLGDYLGVRQVLWVGEGIAGDDTSGHVDDFVRFVAPGKVVLAQERNRRDVNYRPLARARERLTGARDARGRRVDVIPLPMPEPLGFNGERLPASYANFYLANGLVLVPTFNDPRDRQALGLFAELFPRRRVVGIHCVDLVLGLGTLHCSTQQQPARMLPSRAVR